MITMRHLSMRGRGCRYSRVIKQFWRQSQSVFSFDRCLPWFFYDVSDSTQKGRH